MKNNPYWEIRMTNNMAVEKRNKLQNWRDVLTVVTNYSKLEVKLLPLDCFSVVTWMYTHNCYMKFLVIILYLLMYQSWDAYVLIRFISHFWSKINTRAGCNKDIKCSFKKKLIPEGYGRVYSEYESSFYGTL